jgi:hypothetical protein
LLTFEQELSATTAPVVELQHLTARAWEAEEQATVQALQPASGSAAQVGAEAKAELEVDAAAQRQLKQATSQAEDSAGRVPEQDESETTWPLETHDTERVWVPEPQGPETAQVP